MSEAKIFQKKIFNETDFEEDSPRDKLTLVGKASRLGDFLQPMPRMGLGFYLQPRPRDDNTEWHEPIAMRLFHSKHTYEGRMESWYFTPVMPSLKSVLLVVIHNDALTA